MRAFTLLSSQSQSLSHEGLAAMQIRRQKVLSDPFNFMPMTPVDWRNAVFGQHQPTQGDRKAKSRALFYTEMQLNTFVRHLGLVMK
jgi:hypothetical protein